MHYIKGQDGGLRECLFRGKHELLGWFLVIKMIRNNLIIFWFTSRRVGAMRAIIRHILFMGSPALNHHHPLQYYMPLGSYLATAILQFRLEVSNSGCIKWSHSMVDNKNSFQIKIRYTDRTGLCIRYTQPWIPNVYNAPSPATDFWGLNFNVMPQSGILHQLARHHASLTFVSL